MSAPAVIVDRSVCIGSGMCCVYAPESFEIDAESRAVYRPGAGVSLQQVETAVEACPTGALSIAAAGASSDSE